MLPPDRIITVRPRRGRTLSVGGQRDRAAGFADQMCPVGNLSHRGANLVLRHGDHAVQHLLQVCERQARTVVTADRRRSCGSGPRSTSPPDVRRRRPSAVSAASSGSTPKTRAAGHSALIAVPIPDASPPPLTGISTVVDVGQILGDLEADGALPRDDVGVVERRHQHAAGLLHQLRGDLFALPAPHSTTSAPWPRVAATLTVGRFLRHDDGCRNPVYRGRIGHSLGVVAARIGDDAAGRGRIRRGRRWR